MPCTKKVKRQAFVNIADYVTKKREKGMYMVQAYVNIYSRYVNITFN